MANLSPSGIHPATETGAVTSLPVGDSDTFFGSGADAAAILQLLRNEVADGSRDLPAISAAIAKAAHALTNASATALAMRQDGVVVCTGRSGDLAPDLGTKLSVDSGISGECL